jgi:hypothetical protein
MAGNWALPESILLGIIAFGFGMAMKTWPRAAAAGLVIGLASLGMHYWIRSTMKPPIYDPTAAARVLEQGTVPVITDGILITSIGWLVGRFFALFRQPGIGASCTLHARGAVVDQDRVAARHH